MTFDTVIILDWSASSTPSPKRPSADAIWLGWAQDGNSSAEYFRTRHDAETALQARLVAERQAGRRVLLGFDFPFGYPAGFAARLTGTAGAGAIWAWMCDRVVDGPDNANNRFDLASRINMDLGGAGPFWGRPAARALPGLSDRKQVDYAALGIAERRRVETVVPRAQPVWKLFTTGSVGSQAIMGLPLIARLAAGPGVAVWPFEPHRTAQVVLAEVYPSLIDPQVRAALAAGPDKIKDAAQARLLALALWRLGAGDGAGLESLLQDVPDWSGRADEGWILGAGRASVLQGVLT